MSDAPSCVRVLLIDDHALFRDGLVRLLNSEPDIEVVAHCESVAKGLQALGTASIDLVLLDVDLGNEHGGDFLAGARQRGFEGPVLIVTAGVSESEAARLLAQGAAGIFLKRDSAQLLAKGIRAVADGRAWIDQDRLAQLAAGSQVPATSGEARLTNREREVLRGVFDGLANKEIASRLELSESTVKAVLQQLFRKTGVRTRSQLVRIVLERYSEEEL
jgi:two-component system nitrate/nitrite response regulator NarL